MGMRSTKFGGLEKFMLALSKSDPNKEHYLVYNEMPRSQSYVKGIGVKNIYILNADLSNGLKLIIGFRRVVKDIRPDIIHLHFGNAFGILTICAKLMGVKKVYKTEHSCWYQNGVQIYKIKNLSLRTKIYTGWGYVYRLIDATLPVSFAVSNQMKSIFGNIILKPIYLGVGDAGCPQRDLELHHNHKFTICSVLFANPMKGADILIEMMSQLKHCEIQLLLIGLNDNNYTAKLHQLAQKLDVEQDITWIGITDNVAKYLLQSDIYVQASRTEALSLAAIEALSFGLPVIGSDVGGLPEVSMETFPVGDWCQLAEIIERYYNNPCKLLADSNAARIKYQHTFTLQKAVSKYNEIYEGSISY